MSSPEWTEVIERLAEVETRFLEVVQEFERRVDDDEVTARVAVDAAGEIGLVRDQVRAAKGMVAKATSKGEETRIDEVDASLDPPLTADTVFAAVAPTIESENRRWLEREDDLPWAAGYLGAVCSRDVAETIYGRPHNRTRINRVAQYLRRLADEGRVLRLRHVWGRSYGCEWTLPGIELGDHYNKRWYVA
jgi:hypothetical protein